MLAAARGIRQRREIGRPIGDMDAIEQAVAGEPRTGVPSKASAAGEMNCTAPLRLWREITSLMLSASRR